VPLSELFASVDLWERIEVRHVQFDDAFGLPRHQAFQAVGSRTWNRKTANKQRRAGTVSAIWHKSTKGKHKKVSS